MAQYKPYIGKNVIETLTLGMYENALFIYREYVQNAADQIDVAVEEGILLKKGYGQINIAINKVDKAISIEDNATGIRSSEVLQFLGDIANSQKDRTKRKGFRGIGRLGGLGYCESLVFETSYKGETTKSTITLNAKQLKLIIEDGSNTMDAATVISVITNLEKEQESEEEHYFKVNLIGVTNEILLDEMAVKNYLSMVAPVPFKEEFTFAKKIYKHFNENNIKIEEYDVHLSLNNEKLYKAYKNELHSKTGYKSVSVIDVDFIKIIDNKNELIALGWYGVTDLLNQIIHQEDIERGIRIRKDNIQIGSEDTLNSYFKEDRFNHHFVGEIYAIGDSFKPNARRDFFNDNATVNLFKSELHSIFDNLHKLSHTSSDIHSGLSKINTYRTERDKYEVKKNNFGYNDEYEEQQKVNELEKLRKDAIKGQKKIEQSLTKVSANSAIKNSAITIFDQKVGNTDLTIDNDTTFDIQEYKKPNLSKLGNKEKEIVFDIFKIIEESISDTNTVIKLKKKIAEKYN